MFELIAAVIAVIGQVVSSSLAGQQNRLSSQVAREQAGIDYEHNKTLAAYGIVTQKERETFVLVVIISLAVLFVIVALVLNKKK